MDRVRYTAAKCFMKIEDCGYSNLVLKEQLRDVTDRREAAFCTALVYGSVSRRLTLEYVLNKFLKIKLSRLDPEIRAVLMTGAYQILYMDKVPDFAAVNESVSLAYAFKKKSAAPLVNAVLRAVRGFDFSEIDSIADVTKRFSVKYSASEYVVGLLLAQYGADTAESILLATLEPQNTYIYFNPLRPGGETDELQADLLQDTFINNIKRYDGCAPLQGSLFADGHVSLMGLWSAAAAGALEAKPGYKVIDCCAAPGGKSAYIAGMMNNRGRILSCDINKSRVKLICETAKRLGADIIEPIEADATVFGTDFESADRVLCDVPCSGLGVMASKPEIRLRSEAADGLCELQRAILANCARYVKRGGRLVYSTCTLNREENEGVVDRFLDDHPDFRAVTPQIFADLPHKDINYVLNLPTIAGEQGFFVATLERM